MSRVLLVFHGLPPSPGAFATGSGIRARAIAEGLAARGHDIELAARDVALAGCGKTPEGAPKSRFPLHLFETGPDLLRIIGVVRPDALVVQQWEALSEIDADLDIPVAVDLVSPRPLEDQFRRDELGLRLLRYARLLSRGDYFFCAGERQRHFYLGLLMFAGVECTSNPIGVVPIGAPPDAPGPQNTDGEPILVCGGVHWPWLEFAGPLSAVLAGLEDAGRGKVVLLGGDYPLRDARVEPDPAAPRDDLLRLLQKGHPRLETSSFVPYDDLLALYRRASAGLDLFVSNAEREIAVSYRTMDYLQCGAAVMTGANAQMAGEIASAGAGWVADPRDDAALRDLAATIVTRPENTEKRRRSAHALATGRFAWDLVIDPLDAFVSAPRIRPKSPGIEDEIMESVVRRGRDHERLTFSLLSQIARLETDVADWRKDALRKEGAIAAKNAEIADKAAVIEEKSAYTDRIRGDLVNRLQEIAAHEARFKTHEVEMREVRRAADLRYAEYERRLAEGEAEFKRRLDEAGKAVENKDAAHERRVEELGKAADLRLVEYERRVEELGKIADLRLAEYERRYIELEFRATAAAKELAELRGHYEKNTEERAKLTQLVEDLEARLREQRDHYENLLASQKSQYQAWLAEKQAIIEGAPKGPAARLAGLLKKPGRR